MVTIVAVRAFGLARAVLRYGERLSSHDLALRQLARLRERFYRRLQPLVPGELRRGGGDLLSRFVSDVDTLSDLYLRALIPLLVAAGVILGASLAAWLILPAAGVAVLVSLLAAALVLPGLGTALAARADRRQGAVRARLTEQLVETIDGAEELLMNGRAGERVQTLDATDAELSRLARTDALAASAATAFGGVLVAAGLVAVLLAGIAAVRDGLAERCAAGVARLPAAGRLRGRHAAARRRAHACARAPPAPAACRR